MKYLTNKDLMREIHISKNTYCSYTDDSCKNYDIILPNIDRINRLTVSQARKNRAARLSDEINAEKSKAERIEINQKEIPNTDLVFRVMTWDHVPESPGRKKTPKLASDHHVKVNFPPFQHFKLSEDGVPYCVGKSHWRGDVHKGHFCRDKGKMTDNLAYMFIKLCERYSSRANWRGYTYVDEMRGQALLQLSIIGLQFDESKSNNPFAYYTAAITNSFTRILNLEKRVQTIRDDILEMNNLSPSYSRQLQNELSSKRYRDNSEQ